jgi:aspartyl-tRNA(Asn)/glutamyl-tRNA(Gln) amidotransferase subunit B
VESEIIRQAEVLEGGGRIVQETRHFDEAAGRSSSGRTKEEATDYRYFPEPDLSPLALDADYVETIRASLPELPAQRRARLQEEFGYSALDLEQMRGAGVLDLVQDTIVAGATPEAAKSWWLNEPLRSAADAPSLPIRGLDVARIIALVGEGTLTNALARQVIEGVLAGEGDPDQVVAARGLAVVRDDDALAAAVDAAIAGAPEIADKVRGGKLNAVGPLVGGVMKAMRGQADAAQVRSMLLERLGAS